MKRILYFIRLYHKSIEESRTDTLGNSSELALHYKVEIVKYCFMLVINFIEASTCGLFAISMLVTSLDPFHNQINNCTIGDIYNPEFRVRPITIIFTAVVNAASIFSVALLICLMRYLDIMYHDINGKTFPFIRRILVITLLIGIAMMATGSVPQLFIIEQLVWFVVGAVNLILLVRQTRSFYKTLKWRSIEFKVRGRSTQAVRRSIISCHHFAILMSMNGLGFLCIIFKEFIQLFSMIIMTAVYYGPCLSHHLYGTSYYEPLLTSKQQIESLHLISEILSGIYTVLTVIAYIVIATPYLIVTTGFFGGKLWKALMYRFGRVRTRFTPSLTDPLIIT